MKHGCMVMTLRLSSSCRSGSRQIHRSQKSTSSSQQYQVHVDHFFRHPRDCPQGIRTPWSNCQWQILLWGFEAAEGGQMSRQVEENKWFLHHDNAPTHTSLAVRQFLTSKNITLIPHPPIRLTSLPCDFLNYYLVSCYSWFSHFGLQEQLMLICFLGIIFIVILFHYCPHVAGDCRVQCSRAPTGHTKALW